MEFLYDKAAIFNYLANESHRILFMSFVCVYTVSFCTVDAYSRSHCRSGFRSYKCLIFYRDSRITHYAKWPFTKKSPTWRAINASTRESIARATIASARRATISPLIWSAKSLNLEHRLCVHRRCFARERIPHRKFLFRLSRRFSLSPFFSPVARGRETPRNRGDTA